uniref:Proteasome assembly chaperone 4 n=1 Tax=Felis catus TaxID=9685 RepID=A0ABI7ZNY5_FELCA
RREGTSKGGFCQAPADSLRSPPDTGPAPAAEDRGFSADPGAGRGRRDSAARARPTRRFLAARPRPLPAPPTSRASPASSPDRKRKRARPLVARLLGSGPADDGSGTGVSAFAGVGPPGGMDGPPAAAGGDVSLHNFSARLWEQLVHFHVMRLTDSLFLWVGATPHLRNLAVAMCNRYPGTLAEKPSGTRRSLWIGDNYFTRVFSEETVSPKV